VADREIESEQAYIDRAHERLEAMRDAARSVASEVVAQGAGGTFAARVERDIRVELSGRRLAHLDIGDAAVAFGRLDLRDGDRYYIGRLAVFDEDGDPLVVDWRAPVAEPFYRAIPAEPLGVIRRRHFMFRGRQLNRIEDELLDRDSTGDLVLVGEAALLAGLERARTGRMGDIVATIQAEQDTVIRSELPGALVVQGGPGTGKTAVALHRAAYLLFTHRARLERQGVLLVGPNTVFLRYIEQVLPSLGEQAATLATPSELYAGATRPRAIESHAAAAVKGDARMADVLRRSVETRQRPLRQHLVVRFGAHELTVSQGATRRLVQGARQRRGTHNERRPYIEQQLSRLLTQAWRAAEESAIAAGKRAPLKDEEVRDTAERLSRDLRRLPESAEALERMWPILTPEQLLHDLFGAPALLQRAAEELLSPDEIRLLERPRSESAADAPWTDADIPLLDEAGVLLGPVSAARRRRRRRSRNGMSEAEAWMLERALDDQAPSCPTCGAVLSWAGGRRPWKCEQPSCGRIWESDEVLSEGERDNFERVRAHVSTWFAGKPEAPVEKGARTYGHILVDEAQAMSPMQWRSLSRRSLGGSFTIVGDLGQASGALAPKAWADVLGLVPGRGQHRVAELSVNYRTPVEVMDVAARVLAEAAPHLSAPYSVRSSGRPPVISETTTARRLADVGAIVQSNRQLLGEGRVAVLVPEDLAAEVAEHLSAPVAMGAALGPGAARHLLDAPVCVLTVDAARGLEFDSVVILEPADIVEEHSQGLRALYIALTRTTRLLHILHSAPLPESLRPAQELSAAQR
jgi:DNA helicase IV